jgi:hypothetical protein
MRFWLRPVGVPLAVLLAVLLGGLLGLPSPYAAGESSFIGETLADPATRRALETVFDHRIALGRLHGQWVALPRWAGSASGVGADGRGVAFNAAIWKEE